MNPGRAAHNVTNCLRLHVVNEWPIDVTIAIIVVIVTSMDWPTPSACDKRYISSAESFGTSGTSHRVYTRGIHGSQILCLCPNVT